MFNGIKSKAQKINGKLFLFIPLGIVVLSCGHIPQTYPPPWDALKKPTPSVARVSPNQEAPPLQQDVKIESGQEKSSNISSEKSPEISSKLPQETENDALDEVLQSFVPDSELFLDKPSDLDAEDPATGSKSKNRRTYTKRGSLAKQQHPKIDRYIQTATTTDREYFTLCLRRFDKVRPTMEAIFAQHGLPRDLVYLSFVESGGKATATSRMGAGGYWQFLPGTARLYGLRVDKWVDERRDLEKSTHAAAEYLKYLHELFDDWLLACAAYNAGEGAIYRVLSRNKQVDSFWDISHSMICREETMQFVPKILGTIKICKNREQYGFPAAENIPQADYDTVKVKPYTPLAQIAEITGAPLSELVHLNTALVRQCAPPYAPECEIKVPRGAGGLVALALAGSAQPMNPVFSHVVQKKDTLSGLARKYHTTPDMLMALNKMSRQGKLKRGDVLLIPDERYVRSQKDPVLAMAKASTNTKMPDNAASVPQESASEKSVAHKTPAKKKNLHAQSKAKGLITYNVKKGDTIWSISRHYAVSPKDVMRWNQNMHRIRPGDKLTIFTKS